MFTRILIRLRWPMVLTAAVLLSFAFTSPYRYCWAVIPVGEKNRLAVGFRSGATMMTIVHDTDTSEPWRWDWGDNLIRGGFDNRVEPNWSGWWDFAGYEELILAQQLFVLPTWVLAAPLGLLSWVGFTVRRKRMLSPGHCSRCHYLLKGASICPECGRSAPPN